MNRELFQKIHDIIGAQTAERRVHYQQTWESQGSCGTTRCVAGWAIHLTTGEPVFVHDSAITPPAHLSPSLVELARARGISADSGDADYFDLIPLLARDLLGLTEKDAYTLFFVADTPEARTAVRMAAHGDVAGFTGLLRSIRDDREYDLQYREVFQ